MGGIRTLRERRETGEEHERGRNYQSYRGANAAKGSCNHRISHARKAYAMKTGARSCLLPFYCALLRVVRHHARDSVSSW